MVVIEKDDLSNFDLEDTKQLDLVCHIYALIAWNGKTFDEAKQMVMSLSREQLEEITHAQSSINVAKSLIIKNISLLNGNEKVSSRYDVVMDILNGIHDEWVKNNAKKYNRDAENNDKRLFQHLPTALIGLDELAKDMIFLSPYLRALGVRIGSMNKEPYGAFQPSEEMSNAYLRFVESFIKDNVANNLSNIIDNYQSLKGDDDVSKERIRYMKSRVGVLHKQIAQQNSQVFGEKEEVTF